MSSCREQLLFSERENLPKVLAFRFESSILKDEEVEQIFLPAEALNDDGDTATANLLGDDGKYLNKVSIRMESTGQMNTFSGIPVTRTGENNDQNWRFTGSTLSEKRIVVQYVKELKDLGNRARARLEEEKMKRPEIQILDRMPTSDPDKKTTKKATSFSANIASQKPWTASIGRKRKLDVPQTKSTKPKPMKRTETSYKTTDWVPDVSHIELPEKGKVSVTVKLHGVPLDCTVENVKKFFAGLQPESISILLPNNAAIKQLDASNPRRHYNDKIDIRLRIIVSFKSASMAILASDRSGETMVIQQNGREKQFVIAVTALCEELDRALSMVTIPAVPGMSFETTVKHITTMQLHPMVDKVLWSIASRRILHDALPMDGNIQKAEIVLRTEEEKGLWVCSQTTTTWQSNPVYRRFAKHYNRLVDIQDELIHQLPYPLVDTNGGSLEGIGGPTDQDPVVQLTTNACKALANELDFIENLLYRARIFHQLKQE